MGLRHEFRMLEESPHWHQRSSMMSQWRAQGYLPDRLMTEQVCDATRQASCLPVVFGSREYPSVWTNGQLLEQSFGVARAFRRLGLREGDVLIAYVPNRAENTLSLLAALHLGLIYVPVVHIYGPAELSFIARRVGAKALVMPDRWKSFDYGQRLSDMDLPEGLEHIIVIGEQPMPRDVVRWSELDQSAGPDLPRLRARPDDPWLVLFTSGTTAAPKGVVHTHNSFGAEVALFPSAKSPTGAPKLWPLPSGHSAGLIGALRPFIALDPTVLMDVFDLELAKDLIRRHHPDRMGGVPVVVSALLDAASELFPDGLIQMSMGITSIPPELARRCERQGWPATRTYGSSEHPTISGAFPSDPFEKRTTTDGRLLPGVSIRLVDDDGREVPVGTPGEIVSMGPELFKGYLEATDNEQAFAADGWFHTGDIGVLDDDEYLSIVDRKKDIIIRSGENISSKEVEDILTLHPLVVEAAVVARPHRSLGEQVCAFVRTIDEQPISLGDIAEHFRAHGFARQKAPEHLVVLPEFPRNAMGKILKTELRQIVREIADD